MYKIYFKIILLLLCRVCLIGLGYIYILRSFIAPDPSIISLITERKDIFSEIEIYFSFS